MNKLAFHDADADTDILASIPARIVARMSACRSACHWNNFRKSRVSDVSARIRARMSESVSWNSYPARSCQSSFPFDASSSASCDLHRHRHLSPVGVQTYCPVTPDHTTSSNTSIVYDRSTTVPCVVHLDLSIRCYSI